jgi:EAL domain-containing protein (putative c-di-GMP-specific phosphodiesterase class I)
MGIKILFAWVVGARERVGSGEESMDSTSSVRPTKLSSAHRQRVRAVIFAGCAMAGTVSFGWGLVFASMGLLPALGLQVFFIAASAASAWLAHRGRLRLASGLLIAVMYVLVCISALVLDLVTPQTPRSVTLLLLVLGVVAGLLLRDERRLVRHGVPAICLVSFVVLGAGDLRIQSALVLPGDLRAAANWLNHGLAAAMIYMVLHVLQTDVAERTGLESELTKALLQGDLALHYQPQVDGEGRVIGAEALARWNHPRRGLIPPGEFIPLAERCGLMVALGDVVLRTACSQLAQWARQPLTAGLTLSVNVSAVEFEQADFVERVLARVREAGATPGRLRLELTETVLANDLEAVIARMTALRTAGIGIALDDFGTGFSSLSYLRRLPLVELKIDRSFVGSLLASPDDAAIARTVIALGRSLGLAVIAEGVETATQRDLLAGMGCQAFQGYLFGRPAPAEALDAMLAGLPALRTAQGLA